MTKPTPEQIHEAMQDAPHDGEPYRQARAAISGMEGWLAGQQNGAHLYGVERTYVAPPPAPPHSPWQRARDAWRAAWSAWKWGPS